MIEVLPCYTAREGGAEFVIGVDTGLCICRAPIIGDGFDEIQRVMEIMSFYLNNQHKKSADLLIEPEVKGIHWTDFLKYRELIREGEKAAESKIEEIRKILDRGREGNLFQRAMRTLARPLKRHDPTRFYNLGKKVSSSTKIRRGVKEKGGLGEKSSLTLQLKMRPF